MATSTETTFLLSSSSSSPTTTSTTPTEEEQEEEQGESPAAVSANLVSTIFVVSQAILIPFFLFGTCYGEEEEDYVYDVKEYIAFRDIMAMLLLGFGFLMTFLKNYGLGAVGFTMMLSILSMEANLLIELSLRFLKQWCDNDNDNDPANNDSASSSYDDTSWPMPIGMASLIDAEFSAATLMITFGALIGVASPVQMLMICFVEAFFYAFNKVFLVLGYIAAEDVGGSMTIHMFGAYFGLAVSYALNNNNNGQQQKEQQQQQQQQQQQVPHIITSPEPDKVSDIMALIGTTILWVFWPSFVGATETGVPVNEMRCVVNTISALLASTTAAFYFSHKVSSNGKFDPVHVANSSLAGGVAIGSAARLDIGPGGAIVVGAVAGAVSVYGYKYSTPFLESKYGILDTCGVGNLHGYPSLVGGLMSIIFVVMDSDAEFLESASDEVAYLQMLRQLAGVCATLLVAISSGYGTGLFVKPLKDESTTTSYADAVWWHLEY